MTQVPARPRRGRRWLLTFLAAIMALAAAVVAAVWQGAALRYGAQYAARAYLGAGLEIGGVSLGRTISFEGVAVRDLAAPLDAPEAMRVARGAIAYALRPEDGRYLERVALEGAALQLHWDAQGSNLDFLVPDRAAAGPPRFSPLAFVPKSLEIGGLELDLAREQERLRMGGLDASAHVRALDDFDFRVAGGPAPLELWLPGAAGPQRYPDGSVALHLTRAADRFEFDVRAALPEVLEAEAEASASMGPAGWDIDVHIEGLDARPSPLADLALGLAPVPVRFERFTAAGTRLRASSGADGFQLHDSAVEFAVEGLVAGPPEEPYYTGALRVSGGAALDGAAAFEAEAWLNRGQALQLRFAGDGAAGVLDATAANWSREDLHAVLPAQALGLIAPFAQERIDGEAGLRWDAGGWELALRAAVGARGGAEAALEATATRAAVEAEAEAEEEAEGDEAAAGAPYTGAYTLTFGEGRLSGTYTFRDAADYEVQMTARAVDPARWMSALMDNDAFSPLKTAASGTLRFVPDADPGAPHRIHAALDAPSLAWGGLAVPGGLSTRAEGELRLPPSLDEARSNRFRIRWDDANHVLFRQARLRWAPAEFRATAEGEAEVDRLAEAFGLGDAYGALSFSGPIAATEEEFTADFQLSADPLGYGDFVAPYGHAVTARGALSYRIAGQTGRIRGLSAAIGAGSRLEMPALEFGFEGPSFSGPFELETDFLPLTMMGYFLAFDGRGAFSGRVSHAGGSTEAELRAQASAERIVLPKTYAELRGLEYTGDTAYEAGALRGAGRFFTSETRVAGATIRGLDGAVRFEGDSLYLDDARIEIFGGSATVSARIGLLAEGFPISLEAEVEGIDLAAFTEEIQPPVAKLTGRASGQLSFAIHAGEFTALALRLESTEGFSLNRDAVEQALLAEQLRDVSGGRTMDVIVQRTIGAAAQRPFDSAFADLRLEDQRLLGPARLESRNLNLTVDLRVDWESILQGMRIRQRD